MSDFFGRKYLPFYNSNHSFFLLSHKYLLWTFYILESSLGRNMWTSFSFRESQCIFLLLSLWFLSSSSTLSTPLSSISYVFPLLPPLPSTPSHFLFSLPALLLFPVPSSSFPFLSILHPFLFQPFTNVDKFLFYGPWRSDYKSNLSHGVIVCQHLLHLNGAQWFL